MSRVTAVCESLVSSDGHNRLLRIHFAVKNVDATGSTRRQSRHVFPGRSFFEKQIPLLGASAHMQIRTARVFSIP